LHKNTNLPRTDESIGDNVQHFIRVLFSVKLLLGFALRKPHRVPLFNLNMWVRYTLRGTPCAAARGYVRMLLGGWPRGREKASAIRTTWLLLQLLALSYLVETDVLRHHPKSEADDVSNQVGAVERKRQEQGGEDESSEWHRSSECD
jgi:hypothetical protein